VPQDLRAHLDLKVIVAQMVILDLKALKEVLDHKVQAVQA
jgi:hypothetical protein